MPYFPVDGVPSPNSFFGTPKTDSKLNTWRTFGQQQNASTTLMYNTHQAHIACGQKNLPNLTLENVSQTNVTHPNQTTQNGSAATYPVASASLSVKQTECLPGISMVKGNSQFPNSPKHDTSFFSTDEDDEDTGSYELEEEEIVFDDEKPSPLVARRKSYKPPIRANSAPTPTPSPSTSLPSSPCASSPSSPMVPRASNRKSARKSSKVIDQHQLEQRQKQIDFGYQTLGYIR